DGRDGQRDAERDAERLRVCSEAAHGATAAVRDREHRKCCTERVGERDEDRARADAMQAGEPADGAEHRTGAGNEDEPEAGAENEAPAEVAAVSPRQARKRTLEPLAGA